MSGSEDFTSDAIDLLEIALHRIDELPFPELEQTEIRKRLWALLPLLNAVQNQIQLATTGNDSASSERLALEAPDLTAEHPDTDKTVAQVLFPIVSIQTDPNLPLIIKTDWDPIWKQRVEEEVRDRNKQIAEKQFGFPDDQGEIHFASDVQSVTVDYVRAVAESLAGSLKDLAIPLPFRDAEIAERIREAKRTK